MDIDVEGILNYFSGADKGHEGEKYFNFGIRTLLFALISISTVLIAGGFLELILSYEIYYHHPEILIPHLPHLTINSEK